MPECRFTSTALGALRLAQENAARLGPQLCGQRAPAAGPGQPGVQRRPPGPSRAAGLDSQTLRSAIAQLVGIGVPARSLHQGLTPQCCQIIQQAAAESRRLGQHTVSAEHLLLGLLRERDAWPAGCWPDSGVDLRPALPGDVVASLGGEDTPHPLPDPGRPERELPAIPGCWTSAPGT